MSVYSAMQNYLTEKFDESSEIQGYLDRTGQWTEDLVEKFMDSKHLIWCRDDFSDPDVTPNQHVAKYFERIDPIEELRKWGEFDEAIAEPEPVKCSQCGK